MELRSGNLSCKARTDLSFIFSYLLFSRQISGSSHWISFNVARSASPGGFRALSSSPIQERASSDSASTPRASLQAQPDWTEDHLEPTFYAGAVGDDAGPQTENHLRVPTPTGKSVHSDGSDDEGTFEEQELQKLVPFQDESDLRRRRAPISVQESPANTTGRFPDADESSISTPTSRRRISNSFSHKSKWQKNSPEVLSELSASAGVSRFDYADPLVCIPPTPSSSSASRKRNTPASGRSSSISLGASGAKAIFSSFTSLGKRKAHTKDSRSLPSLEPISDFTSRELATDQTQYEVESQGDRVREWEAEVQLPIQSAAFRSPSDSMTCENLNRKSLGSSLGLGLGLPSTEKDRSSNGSRRRSLGSELGLSSSVDNKLRVGSDTKRKSRGGTSDLETDNDLVREVEEESQRIQDSKGSTQKRESVTTQSSGRTSISTFSIMSQEEEIQISPDPTLELQVVSPQRASSSRVGQEELVHQAESSVLEEPSFDMIDDEILGNNGPREELSEEFPTDGMDPLTLHRHLYPARVLETLEEVSEDASILSQRSNRRGGRNTSTRKAEIGLSSLSRTVSISPERKEDSRRQERETSTTPINSAPSLQVGAVKESDDSVPPINLGSIPDERSSPSKSEREIKVAPPSWAQQVGLSTPSSSNNSFGWAEVLPQPSQSSRKRTVSGESKTSHSESVVGETPSRAIGFKETFWQTSPQPPLPFDADKLIEDHNKTEGNGFKFDEDADFVEKADASIYVKTPKKEVKSRQQKQKVRSSKNSTTTNLKAHILNEKRTKTSPSKKMKGKGKKSTSGVSKTATSTPTTPKKPPLQSKSSNTNVLGISTPHLMVGEISSDVLKPRSNSHDPNSSTFFDLVAPSNQESKGKEAKKRTLSLGDAVTPRHWSNDVQARSEDFEGLKSEIEKADREVASEYPGLRWHVLCSERLYSAIRESEKAVDIILSSCTSFTSFSAFVSLSTQPLCSSGSSNSTSITMKRTTKRSFTETTIEDRENVNSSLRPTSRPTSSRRGLAGLPSPQKPALSNQTNMNYNSRIR